MKCLRGLSFDIACETLKQLKEQKGRRFMLLLSQDDSLSLVEFDRKRAIPVWLDVIYQQLVNKLR